MEYKKYAPHDVLKNYIRYFWSFDSFQSTIKTIHIKSFADKSPRLIFQDLNHFDSIYDLSGNKMPMCYLSGLDTKDTDALMSGTFSHFGVSFYPHALHAIFKNNAVEFLNNIIDLDHFVPKDLKFKLSECPSHHDRVTLLNHFFYNKIYSGNEKNLLVDTILQSNDISYNADFVKLQEKYKISERQLERKFKTSTGISPKKYQRLIRFEKALELLSSKDNKLLTEVGYVLNYSDQSHFIKDFKDFSGMTPKEFAKSNILGSESASFLYSIE